MSKLNCILLVDDDTATNFYHEIIIGDMDVANHIQVCDDGEEALNFLSKQKDASPEESTCQSPELIFLDVNMPGMDGFDFLDEYQKLPGSEKGNFVIVMLTTSLMDVDKQKASEYPELAEFRNKPLTEKDINELLNKYFVN